MINFLYLFLHGVQKFLRKKRDWEVFLFSLWFMRVANMTLWSPHYNCTHLYGQRVNFLRAPALKMFQHRHLFKMLSIVYAYRPYMPNFLIFHGVLTHYLAISNLKECWVTGMRLFVYICNYQTWIYLYSSRFGTFCANLANIMKTNLGFVYFSNHSVWIWIFCPII